MRRLLGSAIILGAAVGAGVALRNYLQNSAGAVQGEVRITLDGGAEVEPDGPLAREFVEIAQRVLEISG